MNTDYAELHAHSYYSLLDGASSPEDLIKRAAEMNMPALALTDHDAVYGAVRFAQAAQQYRVHPVFGAEITLDGGHHLTLLVKNAVGWQNLCWLITEGRNNAPKGESRLPFDALQNHTAGLIALSGCRHGEISIAIQRGDWTNARTAALRYCDLFSAADFRIELQHHLQPGDDALVYKLVALSRQIGVGYVATNNVHYVKRDLHRLQDVLVSIRHNTPIDATGSLRRPNSEFYLKSGREMQNLFSQYPAALTSTLHIAERCQFTPRYGLQALPNFEVPDDQTSADFLRGLCEVGLNRKFPDPARRVTELLDRELTLISQTGLANYFLIVWDIVRFARENGILCQGRGSAANSLVAWLLNISPINPLAHDLVFERFLSEERPNMPDIDIDFQADRREEVIQYVYGRYGRENAAMACTFVTFRSRSAIREVGKALGLPPEMIDENSSKIRARNPADAGRIGLDTASAVISARLSQDVITLCNQIYGLPRHLGIHNGGMIITDGLLSTRVPTEPATMTGRSVVQWDKDSLEDAGIIKIDILGLRMLSLIAEACALVKQRDGITLDLDHIRLDDPQVFAMISQADTIGVFQVESRAQAQVLPRLQPRTFNDLIVSISLIRPGPVQGNMVHPYLRRRFGEEQVRYAHPILEKSLSETLGVILFQEQVLKVARDLGKLTPGQGEQLRRALAKGNPDAVAKFKAAFTDGALQQGVSRQVADEVFGQLQAFGGYSFPKSHAAAFAVLVYQSAWLKCHHPAAFYAALLNNQPMGFWSPAVICNDARRHGFRILPVNIHRSADKCTLEGSDAIRLGLRYVNGIADKASTRIITARAEGRFTDLRDFCRRTALPRLLIERLIMVGALDGWHMPRRELIWQLGEITYAPDELNIEYPHAEVSLPDLTDADRLHAEYSILGLTTGDHAMTFYRPRLRAQGVLSSIDLAKHKVGNVIQIAGLVVMHQAPPTAKGHHFLTLEDEFGLINVIFRPDVYTKVEDTVVDSPALIVTGEVQRKGSVVNVIGQKVQPL